MQTYDVVGMMSGTSLDGLDMLRAKFRKDGSGTWRYETGKSCTVAYPEDLQQRLASAVRMSGVELARLDADYGHFAGRALRDFVEEDAGRPDFAAVHGHTVFHQPEKGFTLQIGSGAAMAAESGMVIVNDFRSTDVALGGQGAPLVPIGDDLLFPMHDFCLNLGGIANISYRAASGKRAAFDICVCNMALNHYARKAGMAFDKDGRAARRGNLLPDLSRALDALPYYRKQPPKSLGFEWFESVFLPLTEAYADRPVEDVLHTLVAHIAKQVALVRRQAEEEMPPCGKPRRSVLLTGGGALNAYLAERIAESASLEIVPADRCTIEYKEALIFAFLGVLRMERQCNCLSSVTGALRDSIGGAVYLP